MVGVPTQSQGRGHGEGGGVQYQTLNSELEELFRQEASWGQFFLQDADFYVMLVYQGYAQRGRFSSLRRNEAGLAFKSLF